MIEQLFLKSTDSSKQSILVKKLDVGLTGIEHSRCEHPLKQILILPTASLTDFSIKPGLLKEDVVINAPFDCHDLASGTVLRIGTVEVRLTFHCELSTE